MTSHAHQLKIDKSIEQISAVANLFPGVIIVHQIKDGAAIWMSNRGLDELNITLTELTSLSPDEYYDRYFNSEDAKDYVPKITGMVERNNDEETYTFFQQVRFSKSGDWNWHLSSIKIFLRDEENKPILLITISMPVDAMHHMAVKAERLLKENNFLRKNLDKFLALSSRERKILSLMAFGKSAKETATILFITQNTVETHRKNIKQKLNTTSYYQLCEYARAFDLV